MHQANIVFKTKIKMFDVISQLCNVIYTGAQRSISTPRRIT